MALIYHEDTVIAGGVLRNKVTGAALATFSSQTAAAHAWNMLRAGNKTSARWADQSATTAGDRTLFDALP